MKAGDAVRRRPTAAESGRALHPELEPEARRALLLEGIALFDRGDHFEAHERFEDIWRSRRPEPRDLFQGLVLVAAGFHHLRVRQRPDVARRLLRRAVRRLAPLGPECCGVDLAALLAALEVWDRHLAGAASEPGAPRIPVAEPTRLA